MNDIRDFCPVYDRPPVVETKVSVQFKPLSGIRAIHIGLFWQECLGTQNWVVVDDLQPLPHEVERFDTPTLNPLDENFGEIDSLAIRSVFRSVDERATVHFQPDRIVYSCSRKGSPTPSYEDLRREFDPLLEKFIEFAKRNEFSEFRPDLWEVTYVNAIPKGNLWDVPADWSRVLPGLFPAGGVAVEGHDWATFDGEWIFVMPNKSGRVRAKVKKAIANQTGEMVLLLVIRAAGPLGNDPERTWKEGLDLGHASAVRLFYQIASPEARITWGHQP